MPLDGRVLAFTLCVSVLTSVLFGMLPALAVRRVDLRSSIASRAVASGDRLRLRQVLIAGEVALTVVLLAGSGLLIRTLIHLQTLPPGFNANGVMTAKASLDDVRFHDPAAFNRLLTESIAAMRRIPGVENAAMGLSLPYERALNSGVMLSDHRIVGADELYVTPGYFETLQIPLLAGRTFADSDGTNAQHVAIVNRTFARKFFPGEDPVGRTVDKDVVIVGVVSDIQLSSGLNPTAPLQTEEAMYIPAAQVDPKLLAVVHVWFQPSWIAPHGEAGGGPDRADATRPEQCRSRSAFLRLLQHARHRSKDTRQAAGGGGSVDRHGRPGPDAERGWHLRLGGEHCGTEDP